MASDLIGILHHWREIGLPAIKRQFSAAIANFTFSDEPDSQQFTQILSSLAAIQVEDIRRF